MERQTERRRFSGGESHGGVGSAQAPTPDMTADQFVCWLRGFAEGSFGSEPSPDALRHILNTALRVQLSSEPAHPRCGCGGRR